MKLKTIFTVLWNSFAKETEWIGKNNAVWQDPTCKDTQWQNFIQFYLIPAIETLS